MRSFDMSLRRKAQAFSIFLLLTALHTWPLVTALHEYSRDNDDQRLNMWAVSWIAHQLPLDPLHLFDGNIFHPNRFTLAYSEPLILPGLMGAPIRWLGGSPILAYNVLVMSGLVLTAFAMYLLVTRWTHDHYAGLLSGALLAFSTQLLTRLPHLQILHLYWLPLSILALDPAISREAVPPLRLARFLRDRRRAHLRLPGHVRDGRSWRRFCRAGG